MSLLVNVLTSFGKERPGTSKFESKKTAQRFGRIKLFYVLPCLYIYYIWKHYSAQLSIFGSQETDFTNQREVSSFNELKQSGLTSSAFLSAIEFGKKRKENHTLNKKEYGQWNWEKCIYFDANF